MYSSFFKFYFLISIILILISTFTIKYSEKNPQIFEPIDSSKFNWPLPGNMTITSKFGYRKSPTTGASTYHSGIDIAATEGTPIYAVFPGKVILASFKGAGGYTISIENNGYIASYCHISPNYLYKIGDYITSNSIVAYVGPKNVYNVQGNPYIDSNR